MNTQGTLAGYRDTRSFVNELSKHLKIVKVCDNNDLASCFEDKVLWGGGDAGQEEVEISKIKTAKDFGLKDKWSVITDIVGFQLNNGTNGLIAYNPDCKQDPFSNQVINVSGSTNGKRGSVSLGTDCIAVLYDTSGFAKPNTQGKDLRAVNVFRLGGNNCAFDYHGICYSAAFSPTPMSYAECAGENATSPGTITPAGKEASALGIKNCYYDNDYWAGAVKTCGGVNKLTSDTDLRNISTYDSDGGREIYLKDYSYYQHLAFWNNNERNTGKDIGQPGGNDPDHTDWAMESYWAPRNDNRMEAICILD